MKKLKWSVSTYPGWNEDPYGQHAVELVMAVTGPEGAVVWRLATGIAPKGPYPKGKRGDSDGEFLYKVNLFQQSDMGLTIHSELNERTAQDTESVVSEKCEFLKGRACVCEYHTGLMGNELFPAFACEGFAGVERILTKTYYDHYGSFK